MPIHRMATKAQAEPRTPVRATKMAPIRCELLTVARSATPIFSVCATAPSCVSAAGRGGTAAAGELTGWKKVVGRAMRVTPTKEMRAPNCSRRVKGSLRSLAQTQQTREGVMNVSTVASARGR